METLFEEQEMLATIILFEPPINDLNSPVVLSVTDMVIEAD